MKTLEQVLMDPDFIILRSNNEKHYLTLSCKDDPVFRLYIPYAFLPSDVLFERSRIDLFGWPAESLPQDSLDESECATSESGRR
jgi:hypothetical protein